MAPNIKPDVHYRNGKRVMFVRVSETGRRVGECHQRAVLSDEQVEKIRSARDSGIEYKRIAMMMCVSVSLVAKICRYERRATTVMGTRCVEVHT